MEPFVECGYRKRELGRSFQAAACHRKSADYDRHSYEAEKREAADGWSARVAEFVRAEVPLGPGGFVMDSPTSSVATLH